MPLRMSISAFLSLRRLADPVGRTLPTRRPVVGVRSEDDPRAARHPRGGLRHGPGVGTMSRVIRVLIADDQELVRTGFRVILEAEGDIEVVAEAENGHEAVRQAALVEARGRAHGHPDAGARRPGRDRADPAPAGPADDRGAHDVRPERVRLPRPPRRRRRFPPQGRTLVPPDRRRSRRRHRRLAHRAVHHPAPGGEVRRARGRPRHPGTSSRSSPSASSTCSA